jgi:hypothetical protein
VIAKVDEFLDAAIHDVGYAVDRGAYLDPLRAQREKGAISFSRDLHGRSTYQLTGCQSDSAGAIAADILYNALQPVVFANELGHEGIQRALIQFIGGRYLLYGAIFEDGDTVRHRQGFGLIMRDVNDGNAKAFMQVTYLILHLFPQLFVECAKGFVHQHEIRIENECAGNRHALLLTTR